MEAAGLLARRPHQSDARLVRLHLTDRGRSLEKVIAEEMDGLASRALGTLRADEVEDLVRYLTEIRRNLG
jgi:DNA-binding MarR family transcriptional regulator